MPDLPAAARLVAWGNACLTGAVSPDEAAERVTGPTDPTNRVFGLPGESGGVSLTYALARLRAIGATSMRLALPRPGDVSGLPGPPSFNERALASGAAALAAGPTPLGLLAESRGAWTVHQVAQDVRTPVALADAERDLNRVMHSSTARLVHLDVARWQPAAAEVLAHQRQATRSPLPAKAAPRAAQVLDTALRLMSIVDVARADDGAAVSGAEMTARREVLRDLETAARRAVEAACSEPPSR
ncbi:MAG: hypothetical protein ABJA93_14705 [Sporichthyaceae bacterium]